MRHLPRKYFWLKAPSVVLDNQRRGAIMNSPKAEATAMLESLPEDSSFEDIQYHLYVLEKIRFGIERPRSKALCHMKTPRPA